MHPFCLDGNDPNPSNLLAYYAIIIPTPCTARATVDYVIHDTPGSGSDRVLRASNFEVLSKCIVVVGVALA